MITKLKFFYSNLDAHTAEVVKKSATSTIVKVVGMLIGLGVSIFLGRSLGVDGLGIINLANRIVQLLLIVGLLGMRQVIVKEVAIARNNNDLQHIGNVMHTAYLLNGAISLSITILMILMVPWLSENVFHDTRLTWPLIIVIMVMTPQVFSRVFSSGLIGYRKIWQSNLVDQTLSIAVTGLILLGIWLSNLLLTINSVAIAYGIGRLVVTISISIYWKSLYKFKGKKVFIGKELLITALPLLIVSSTSIIAANAAIIMLGWLSDSTNVGLYSVAARIALLSGFLLQVTNSALSPKIASLFHSGNIGEMEKLIQLVTRGLGLIALTMFFVFTFFGNSILQLWGKEFTQAYLLLIILSFGQFFNIATGASGLTLIMCGFERIHRNISVLFVFLNVLLNLILIFKFGAMGAAIATAVTVTGENITKVVFAKKKVGVLTIPFKIKL